MKNHAFVLVQLLDDAAQIRPQHLRQRQFVGRYYMHFQAQPAQGGRHFQPDEAGPNDDGPLRPSGPGHDGTVVGQRAQHVDVGQVVARNVQRDGRRAGGQQ